MKALVTGGCGYFGSLLLEKLVQKGYECSSLDIAKADDAVKGVHYIQGDIRDEETIQKACQNIDVVYHNVAQVPLAKDKSLFQSVNSLGTKILLEAAYQQKVKKIIYTSSSAVFGVPKTNPVNEQTEPTPQEAYGKAKFQAEKICEEYIKDKGLDITIIRPRTILGHGRLGIFQILFEWIYQNKNIPVIGSGDNIYQFIHANDLAEVLILASQKKGPSIYNIGAAKYDTMRKTLEELIKQTNSTSEVRSLPEKMIIFMMKTMGLLRLSPLGPYHALMYSKSLYFDISKAEKELGWRPKHSHVEMFTENYDWYVKNRNKILKKRGGSHHKSALKQGALGILQWFL